MPMQTPPMGMLNLQERARQGDPQAIQMLQELQGGQGQPPQLGMPPPGPGGMSQSQFGGGRPVPPDVAARRAQQLIELLRARDGGGMGYQRQ